MEASGLSSVDATNLLAYVAAIIGYKNRNSRLLSTPFIGLPDARENPRYAQQVRYPRSLIGVQETLLEGKYSSPAQVYADCKLVFRNAQLSNTRSSQNYTDAARMEVAVDEVWESVKALPPVSTFTSSYGDSGGPAKRMRFDGQPPGPIGPHASSDDLAAWTNEIHGLAQPVPAPAPTPAEPAQNSYMDYEPDNSLVSLLGSPGVDLPGTPGPSDLGGHYAAPTPPASNPMKKPRGRPPKFRPPQTPGGFDDSFDPDASYSGFATPAAGDDDGEDHGKAREHRIPDDQSGWLVRAPHEDAQTLYRGIVARIKIQTDFANRQMAAPLLSLPSAEEDPHYYAIVKDPISLEVIDSRITSGYASSEAFDRDMARLFNNARLTIPPERPQYPDILVLRRLWQEITRASRLSMPMPDVVPGMVISSVSFGPGAAQVDDINAAVKFTARERVPLESINIKGETLRVGDFVHLINVANPARPIVGQIFRCFKHAGTDQRYINVNWFYRPEETFHQINRLFYPDEVFKTGHSFDHCVEDYLEHCFVMFHTRYVRGRPKAPHWHQNMPTYVVEHRYYDTSRTFKKIKNWLSCLPEETRSSEPGSNLDPTISVTTPAKVNSPFSRGMIGTGGVGGGELDDEQSRFIGTATGGPLTAQIIRTAPAPPPAPAPAPAAAPPIQAPLAPQPAPAQAPAPALPRVVSVSQSLVVGQSLPAPAAVRAASTPEPITRTTGDTSNARPQHLTPIEVAASGDQFAQVPKEILSAFRTDPRTGEMLWFGAPPMTIPSRPAPQHSLAYLEFLAKKKASAS